MSAAERREEILNILKYSSEAISGTNLSEKLNVSRQIIVGDVALLRATGVDIISTPRGYILNNKENNDDCVIKTIACKHSEDCIEDELNTIVDEGASVINVIIEHGVYGQLTGNLHVSSRRDVKSFMSKLKEEEVNSLARLTDGVHLHTIKCKNEEAFKLISKALKEKGYLY